MLEFPASPVSGEYYTYGIRSWVWNNTAWVLTGAHVDAATLNGQSGSFYLNAGNLTGTYTGIVSGSVTTGQVVGLEEFVEDTIGTGYFTWGTGVTGNYNDTSNTFSISGRYASTTEHGVARFNSTDFTVTAGNVTFNDASVSITASQVSDFTEAAQDVVGASSFIQYSNGVTGTYNDGSNILSISGRNATSTIKGVASFDGSHFTVTAGNVSLGIVPLSVLEGNTGPYILGLSANGVDSPPLALSASTVYGILSGIPLLTGTPRKFDTPIDFSVSNTGTSQGWGNTGYYALKTMNLLNTATGNVLINLPSASSASGRLHFFKKISSDAYTVSISGSTTIDGDASPFILYKQWDCVTLFAADNWYVAAYHFE